MTEPVVDGPSSVRARAPAKVNLALQVGALRVDGFHQLATVYHALDLYDEVVAGPRTDGVVSVVTRDPGGHPVAGVADDDTHLAVRAAQALRAYAGVATGAHLRVRKQIPVAGGLAGGSADAAAALVACAELWGLGTDAAALLDLAAGIGSDVPFGLVGGTAAGTGRGERVDPLRPGPRTTWVLVESSDGLSTAAVYAETARLRAGRSVDSPRIDPLLLLALQAGDLDGVAAALRNDLQEAALALRPELADVLAAGLDAGALGGLVAGSGPTVLLLVADDAQACSLADAVRPVASRSLPGVRLQAVHGPAPGAHLFAEP